MYRFPIAPVTISYKLSDLKQHTFILLQTWRPEVSNESNGVKIKVLAGFVLRTRRETPSLAFCRFYKLPPLLGTRLYPLTLCCSYYLLHLISCFLLVRITSIILGPWSSQNNLPISRFLIWKHLPSPFGCMEWHVHSFWGLQCNTVWGLLLSKAQ